MLSIDRYVVDPGLAKVRGFKPASGMECLLVTPVSKQQARQRSGRAGRESPGACVLVRTRAYSCVLARTRAYSCVLVRTRALTCCAVLRWTRSLVVVSLCVFRVGRVGRCFERLLLQTIAAGDAATDIC